MNETVQEISLNDVYLDRETQIRATVSEETIQRYYDVMVDENSRDTFPPILLFQDNEGNYWLADGHHRVMAAIRRKFQSILAVVRPGTKADAIWEAAKSNSRNGLPLGRLDIRRAVEMICVACPDRSNVVIAEALGVDEKTVRKYRPSNSGSDLSEPEKRVGKDGKCYSSRRARKNKQKAHSNSEIDTATSPETQVPGSQEAEQKPQLKPTEEPVSDPQQRIQASVKETQIHDAISNLAIQIDEWFEIAPQDMHEEFDQRIRIRILELID